MLYRTHHPHPLFFPLNSLSTKFSSPSVTPTQVEKEMECVMKASLRPEMMVGVAQKLPHHVLSDDFPISNPQNAVVSSVSGEDFFVDQLLNLNNDNTSEEDQNDDVFSKEECPEVKQESNNKKDTSFLSPPLETERNKDDFGSVLSVPAEEADLEWLSQFVEESFSQFSAPFPMPVSEKPKPKPEREPGFSLSSPALKARRSKRARTGGRVWSTSLAESPTSSSSFTTLSYPPSPNSDASPPAQPKKQKKRESGPSVGGGGGPQPRKCSHCGVQKTPQWRTGPLGAKTLCNACGVRFKSGRLLPEYRPACSPTFSSELHSNNHRKVLEMRRKKETTTSSAQPEPGMPGPVPSFG